MQLISTDIFWWSLEKDTLLAFKNFAQSHHFRHLNNYHELSCRRVHFRASIFPSDSIW